MCTGEKYQWLAIYSCECVKRQLFSFHAVVAYQLAYLCEIIRRYEYNYMVKFSDAEYSYTNYNLNCLISQSQANAFNFHAHFHC